MSRIALGICGSIASYRSADLVKTLVGAGHQVKCILTESGREFVSVKALETFSKNEVFLPNPFKEGHQGTHHIEVARWADQVVVYGATANFIARLAAGFADDFLTLQISAFTGPVILVPAMNPEMWNNQTLKENLSKLRSRGIKVVDPIAGVVACGEEGVGHVAPDSSVMEAIAAHSPTRPIVGLSGKKVLISAGPMRTNIDPVRYLQNRSSGKMALALARECAKRGALELRILLGPVESSIAEQFSDFKVERFTGASEYGEKLVSMFKESDVFFSAAAVLDFKVNSLPQKMERQQLSEKKVITLEIEPVRDWVHYCAGNKRPDQRVIAFAAEYGTEDEILARAKQKLIKKSVDALIANPVWEGLGPESDQNLVWLLQTKVAPQKVGPIAKSIIWEQLLPKVFNQ